MEIKQHNKTTFYEFFIANGEVPTWMQRVCFEIDRCLSVCTWTVALINSEILIGLIRKRNAETHDQLFRKQKIINPVNNGFFPPPINNREKNQ